MPDLNEEIIRSLSSGVIALDRAGRVITANPAACSFLGLRPGELSAGMPLSRIEHAGPLAELLQDVMQKGEPVSRHEITLTLPGGVIKQIGLSATVHSGPGAFDGVVVLFTDMTERLRLERAAELNRQLAALGELTAGVVHELRNPVSVISGLAELLLRKLEKEDMKYEAAQTILREAVALERSISQFLGFARPFELQIGRCSPIDLIDRTVQLCRRRAETKQVHVAPNSGSHLPPLQADLYRFAQALSNIVNNAIDAVPRGGTVELYAFEDGDSVVFEISDNGPGIHLKPGEDLFTPFFTMKEGGTGLGLTIAHRIITGHGGTVSYANKPEGGATFTVRLPLPRTN